MRNNILFVLGFIVVVMESYAYGENIPSLQDVKVTSEVHFDLNVGIYRYDYKISNSHNSRGDIRRIEIDISKTKNEIALKKDGLVDGKGYLKNTSEYIISTQGSDMVPVGFTAVPEDWMSSVTVKKTAAWGCGEETALITPGQSLAGFILTSYGLPTIRGFYVFPKIDMEKIYPNIDELETDEEVNAILVKIKQDKENAAFKGKTIGPTAPPADFKPVDFLNSIINMKHEAYKLGWINNEGILKSLDAKLENAKKDIEKGNTRSAKNTLKAFINEVEAQGCESYENCASGKHLTSEAYGLLKYNALYLIDSLQIY